MDKDEIFMKGAKKLKKLSHSYPPAIEHGWRFLSQL
jgi:hypothetical protein